jgi:putative glutamine amidotransferase
MKASRPLIGLNLDCNTVDTPARMRINTAYVDAVLAAGGLPLLVPPTDNKKILAQYVACMHGCLFIGGPDYPPQWYGQKKHPKTILVDPHRAAADRLLATLVLKTRMPVLGICGGHQLISIMWGGKLIQHIAHATEHQNEKYHSAIIAGKGILSSLFGDRAITVNSSHHQAVDPRAIGRGLKVSARAEDGTVEAIEGTGQRFLLGVQWHPERIRDKKHRRKIFGAFIKATGKLYRRAL